MAQVCYVRKNGIGFVDAAGRDGINYLKEVVRGVGEVSGGFGDWTYVRSAQPEMINDPFATVMDAHDGR